MYPINYGIWSKIYTPPSPPSIIHSNPLRIPNFGSLKTLKHVEAQGLLEAQQLAQHLELQPPALLAALRASPRHWGRT